MKNPQAHAYLCAEHETPPAFFQSLICTVTTNTDRRVDTKQILSKEKRQNVTIGIVNEGGWLLSSVKWFKSF